MARAGRRLAATIAGLIVVVAAAATIAWHWLLSTESGSGWLWQRIQAAVPGELAAAAVEGTFTGGLDLSALAWANPSLEVTAARVRLIVDPDLFPLSLDIELLEAGDVVVRQLARAERPEPAGHFSPASLALPLEVTLGALSLERLRVLGVNGDALLAVDRAELAGRWHEAIVVSRLDLDSSVGTGRGSAALSLRAPFEANATLAASYPLKLGKDVVPLAFTAAVSGNLSDLDVRVDGTDPALVVEGRLFDLLDAPEWELEARSPALQWPLRGTDPAVSLADVSVTSRGSAADYALGGSGSVSAIAGQALGFSFDATGDGAGIEVGRLRLTGPLLAAEAQGAIGWQDGFGIRADADVARFDPALLTPQWPADRPVSGRASGAFRPGMLELDRLQARVEGTRLSLDAAGLIDLDERVVDMDLDWREVRWPLGEEPPRFRSELGDVAVQGRPDDWTLQGRVGLQTPGLPAGIFELSGNGSREQAALTLHDSEVLGGKVAGRAHYERAEGGRWSADLSAAAIETGALLEEWPGRLSADFTARGRIEPLELAVDIERLSGTLRNQPLEGSGGFRWARGNLAVQDLRLASGESRVRASGSLRGEQGLDFAIDLPALGSLVPRAAGSLSAEGTISLAGEFPRARLDLEGSGLAWRDWRVDYLAVTAREGGEPLLVDVEGRGLDLGGLGATRFDASLAASESRQRIEAAVALDGREVDLALDGRLGDWRRPLESGFSGQLVSLAVALAEDAEFELAAPADLTLRRDLLAMNRACLGTPRDGDARICLAGRFRSANEFSASADLTSMPVNLARLLFDTELEFTQAIDGSLALSAKSGRRLSANARLDISPGQVHDPANPRVALRTRAGAFRLNLEDGQVLMARLNLPVADSTAISAEFSMDDVRQGEDSGISGKVLVNVYDVGVLAALVPTVESARGHLEIDLAVDGTVSRPTVTGDASLTNGSVRYRPLGLALEDIELTSRVSEGNRIDVQSTFSAGAGTGRLYSSTNGLGSAGNEVRLRLTGEDLTIVDLPQVNVVADMDVGVGVTPEQLTLNGDVRIPHARLSPREIASTRVSESEDVVIVASRDGESADEQSAPPPPFAIEGQVDLALGDDVIVDFDAAQTRLSGSVRFNWDGPPMPVASGEYKVAGRFEAYGQLLEITEGSIRFPEVPADNPQLRIRAEREIFGNPRIRTAGVLVSGTAQDPELEVYTTPATTRERALTLLVTGSDFDYEQGVGAVDVGTYIAPDLYLSYGIGLFDRENVISVRYDFGRGFGIKATSGKSTEGVDLSYTFER